MDNFNREIIVLSRKILAEMRGLALTLLGVQKQIEAVAKEQQAKNQREQTPPVMRAILEVPDAEKAQNKGTKTEKKWLNRWKTLIETGTLAAIVAYACINHRQLNEMKRTSDAAKEAADTAWNALQDSRIIQRPWIGIAGGIQVVKPPILEVVEIPQGTIHNIGINMEVRYAIKNVGSAPAFKASTWSGYELGERKPQFEMRIQCSRADAASKSGEGEALLPGGEVDTGFEWASAFSSTNPEDARTIWVMGCIAYQNYSGNSFYHYKFWVKVRTDPSHAIPVDMGGKNLAFKSFSLPLLAIQLAGSEAD
jgi:hypothetical protein